MSFYEGSGVLQYSSSKNFKQLLTIIQSCSKCPWYILQKNELIQYLMISNQPDSIGLSTQFEVGGKIRRVPGKRLN